MKDIHINLFRSRKDNCVRPLPTSWENIVGLFTSGHEVVENKEDIYLFNAVHYRTIDQIPDESLYYLCGILRAPGKFSILICDEIIVDVREITRITRLELGVTASVQDCCNVRQYGLEAYVARHIPVEVATTLQEMGACFFI